ncbi:MAG: hypothetical protein NTY36_04530 [Deltaproteobacteria bacterium]|nr:hypothetical protein [Deltaproteobacteria bacterium]
MADKTIRVYLIVEDTAQESVARALFRRLSCEEGVRISISNAIMGGYGGVLREIKGFQRALSKGGIPAGSPDLLLVLGDSNCHNFQERKKEIISTIDINVFPFLVVGCPDPHIEKWLLIDSHALNLVFGASLSISLDKCKRDYYKDELKRIIRLAGWPMTQEGIEYSQDIIEKIDFNRAERNDQSFKCFISDLRSILRNIKKAFQA